jgi:3-oxoacyl-[acyl-carrier protein] reductase
MKNVLVTGGAKGIGLAIAQRFNRDGHDVFIADNDKAALDKLAMSQTLHPLFVDISSKEISTALGAYGDWDILINNAAITSGDDYERIMAVNCNGTRYITEAVLLGMKARGHGSVIFITSVHTAMAFKEDAAYDASKGWTVGYLKARALEYAEFGIRINAVAPGAICGAGTNTIVSAKTWDELAQKIPLKRWGTPADIANAVAWLASDEASYITGIELRVDGGVSIKNPLQD